MSNHKRSVWVRFFDDFKNRQHDPGVSSAPPYLENNLRGPKVTWNGWKGHTGSHVADCKLEWQETASCCKICCVQEVFLDNNVWFWLQALLIFSFLSQSPESMVATSSDWTQGWERSAWKWYRSALMSFPHLPVRFPLLLQFSLNSIRGEPGLGVDHFPHHYFIVCISLLPKRPAHFSTVNYLYTEAQKRSSIFASRSLQGLAFDSLTLSHCCLSGPLPWLWICLSTIFRGQVWGKWGTESGAAVPEGPDTQAF